MEEYILLNSGETVKPPDHDNELSIDIDLGDTSTIIFFTKKDVEHMLTMFREE